MEERVKELEEKVAAGEANIVNLQRWETTQNGSILRMEQKIDKMHEKFSEMGWKFSGILLGVVVQIALTVFACVFKFK